ncbi:MAG: hypothetical protein ACTHV4_09695 [Canibacter sp.]
MGQQLANHPNPAVAIFALHSRIEFFDSAVVIPRRHPFRSNCSATDRNQVVTDVLFEFVAELINHDDVQLIIRFSEHSRKQRYWRERSICLHGTSHRQYSWAHSLAKKYG